MTDRILVVNAGSSSLKFSLFRERDGEPVLDVHGAIERMAGEGAPHFVARRPGGAVVGERVWPAHAWLGHAGAIEALLAFVRGALGDGRLAGVAHRVVLWLADERALDPQPGCLGVRRAAALRIGARREPSGRSPGSLSGRVSGEAGGPMIVS